MVCDGCSAVLSLSGKFAGSFWRFRESDVKGESPGLLVCLQARLKNG